MQLAVSIHLATIIPSLLQQHGLALIFQRTLTKWFMQPCVEVAGMNQQHPAHRPDRKGQPVLGNKRIPRRDSLAKYAVVGSTGHRNGSSEGISRRLEAKRFSWPCVQPEGDLIKVMLSVDG